MRAIGITRSQTLDPRLHTSCASMDVAHAAHAHANAIADSSQVGHKHGSWAGHVLPGALFCLLGLWWLLASAASFHQRRRAPFRPQPWWPLTVFATSATRHKGLVLLEPVLLTVLPLVSVAIELYFHPGDLWYRRATTLDGRAFEAENLNNCKRAARALVSLFSRFLCAGQHAAMYSAFAFCGACALVLKQPLARPVGFWGLIQAFGIELLLFSFHLRMQTGLTADVHICLCIAVAGCAVSVAAEATMCDTGAIVPTLARCFFTLLQGTWFCQAAHILYGAEPWRADMENSMMLPVILTAHVICGAFPQPKLKA